MNSHDRLRLQRLVDRLLAPWDRPAGPGMTLGPVLEDEPVVHCGAGGSRTTSARGFPICPNRGSALRSTT